MRIPKGSSSKDLSLGQSLADLDLKEFRDKMWERARNLDPWELLPQSFIKLIEDTQPTRVGIFVPKIEWAEAQNLIDIAEAQEKVSELLGLKISDDEMTFHSFNRNQISEAPHDTQHINTESPELVPDLLLIPALACDLKGQRVGRGKGFYDRYISKHPQTLRCAVIHSSFLFDELPAHFFHKGDQKVHYVLTEKDLFKITNGNEVPL